MRILLCVSLLLFVPVTAASAQVRRITVGDSIRAGEILYTRLFDGVDLPKERRTQAQRIIMRTWVQTVTGDFSTEGGYQQRLALMDARDSVLKLMIATPADRARFNANAKAGRPRPPLPDR